MIDWATIFLMHGLLLVMFLRLMGRDDLDRDGGKKPPRNARPSETPSGDTDTGEAG